MTHQAVSIQNLTKYYGKFKALDRLSLDVREGDFFGFLGPNGAGKTTAIRVLTGLANFKEGSARVFGHDVIRDYRKTRSFIGLVPQEFNFDPFFSAEWILRLEGGYFGMNSKEAKIRAEELLKMLNLWEKRNQDYKKLSGGMKRRLLIARALMHRPKLLILDEPTAGVDIELRYELWEFLRKLNREGTTIILTTHYIEEAEQLCETIGVIHEGRMLAVEKKADLVRKVYHGEIEFEIKKALEQIPKELEELGATFDAKTRRLKLLPANGALNRALQLLVGAGVEVEKIEVHEPKLEEAFLKLIRSGEKRSANGEKS
jgi:ABC-2 type transport system ATP-binding protein